MIHVEQIDRAIQVNDRLLLVLSEHSCVHVLGSGVASAQWCRINRGADAAPLASLIAAEGRASLTVRAR